MTRYRFERTVTTDYEGDDCNCSGDVIIDYSFVSDPEGYWVEARAALAYADEQVKEERERIRGNIERRLLLAQTRKDLAHYEAGLSLALEMCNPEYTPPTGGEKP
jgi:hypothetical protein